MMLLRQIFPVLLLCLFQTHHALSKQFNLYSPDKRIKVVVNINTQISYSIFYNDYPILLPSGISMQLNDGEKLGVKTKLTRVNYKSADTVLYPILKVKNAVVPDIYNEYIFKFKNNFSLCFRAYNDGVAYRFTTQKQNSLIVSNEEAVFNLPSNSTVYFPPVRKREDADIFHTSFEGFYQSSKIEALNDSLLFYSPVLITLQDSLKMILTESDIMDYPGMFLRKGKGNSLSGVFAPYPTAEKVTGGDGFRQSIVTERADYIAVTKGSRVFPWRIVAIASTDKSILSNDIVYRLASPADLSDTGWIKPGKSTEEWITDLNLYGVNFKAGLNTETYKYYVDFASRFGLEYVMLDAGWSDVNDLFSITKGMDVKEIIRYADTRNIGIILWTQAETMKKQMDTALDSIKSWGAKIVMTDFIDRDDQKAINFLNKFADECAKRELMVMIHGAPKPAGFSRTHPNALTREAVAGSEYNAWSGDITPEHDMMLPFLRMFSGAMDYEPGILQNATKKHTEKMGMERVVAQGTIMHQLAMFVIYESPLQLFSGNISDAIRHPELMEFFGGIPSVWDETIVLDASFPKYILEARRNTNNWFIGAMNDWTPKDFTLSLDFLEAGEYEVTIAEDGINAERNPHDYRIVTINVRKGSCLHVHLAPGGGYLAHIKKVKL